MRLCKLYSWPCWWDCLRDGLSLPCYTSLWHHMPSWGPSWAKCCGIPSSGPLKVLGTDLRLGKTPSPTSSTLGHLQLLPWGSSQSRRWRQCICTSTQVDRASARHRDTGVLGCAGFLFIDHWWPLHVVFFSVFLAERVLFLMFLFPWVRIQGREVLVMWFLKTQKVTILGLALAEAPAAKMLQRLLEAPAHQPANGRW